MKKLFPRRHQNRGYPDSIHTNGGNSSSSPAVPNLAPPPQLSAFSALSSNPHSSVNDPPIAHPYAPHQEGRESNGVSKRILNVGYNQNKLGTQKIGMVRIGNRATAASEVASSLTIPETIIAGHNTNECGDQEIGDIEIGNVG